MIFEPNGSNKSNTSSVWTKAVSFISDATSRNELSNTYLVSIGLKASDHNVIEYMFI